MATTCGCGPVGNTAHSIFDKILALFSAATSTPAPKSAAANASANASPVDSLALPYAISDAPAAPAGASVPFGTVAPIAKQSPAPRPGFGTSSSVGGNILRILGVTTNRPGEPGGATYNRKQTIVRPGAGASAPSSTPIEPPSTSAEIAAAGPEWGFAPRTDVTRTGSPSGPVPASGAPWETFRPGNGNTELAPWELAALQYRGVQPIKNLSSDPGVPLVNETAYRAPLGYKVPVTG